MQRPYRVAWLLPVLAVALAADPLGADDRNLLRDVSAPPNILIVFDSSGSMIGTPESGPVRAGFPKYAMNPGSGDDPRSRMGIAKLVLRHFLETATNINFAFAQYAQTLPDVNPIYQKHWVYEALGPDRFRIVEPGYAFRFGFNTDFTGGGLIDPADLATDVMIGEEVQYADASAVESRYGPITVATLLGDPALYDKMPIYFGDPTRFVFPGGLADPWSHGTYDTTTMEQRFRRCTADQVDSNDDGTPDDPDACKATWFESLSSIRTRQWQRQARLEMQPDQSWLAVDAGTGLQVGNHQVAGRHGVTDYNADGSADDDIDGDNANDWIMYVDLVEQRRSRDCDTTPSGFPTWTPTPTATATPAPCTFDGSGLLAVYYDGTHQFDDVIATVENDVPDYDWGDGAPLPEVPVDHFTVSWTGQVKAEPGGLWSFCTWSDDGARLYVDGNQAINDWSDHGAQYRCGQAELPDCEQVDIRLDYYENGGQARIKLYWAPPGSAFNPAPSSLGGEYEIIPADHLYQIDGPPPTITPTQTATETPTVTPTATATNTATPVPANCSQLVRTRNDWNNGHSRGRLDVTNNNPAQSARVTQATVSWTYDGFAFNFFCFKGQHFYDPPDIPVSGSPVSVTEAGFDFLPTTLNAE